MSHDPQSPTDAADFEDDDFMDEGEIGCVHCGYDGWNHGCCDDLCYACNEAVDCDNARRCRHCNPHGELPW